MDRYTIVVGGWVYWTVLDLTVCNLVQVPKMKSIISEVCASHCNFSLLCAQSNFVNDIFDNKIIDSMEGDSTLKSVVDGQAR